MYLLPDCGRKATPEWGKPLLQDWGTGTLTKYQSKGVKATGEPREMGFNHSSCLLVDWWLQMPLGTYSMWPEGPQVRLDGARTAPPRLHPTFFRALAGVLRVRKAYSWALRPPWWLQRRTPWYGRLHMTAVYLRCPHTGGAQGLSMPCRVGATHAVDRFKMSCT